MDNENFVMSENNHLPFVELLVFLSKGAKGDPAVSVVDKGLSHRNRQGASERASFCR